MCLALRSKRGTIARKEAVSGVRVEMGPSERRERERERPSGLRGGSAAVGPSGVGTIPADKLIDGDCLLGPEARIQMGVSRLTAHC